MTTTAEKDRDITFQGHVEAINQLSHLQLARLWRFAPPGYPYFSDPDLFEVFEARFTALGGMTPQISKMIGL